MIDESKLQALHLRDPLSRQLGNLASSVNRLGFLIVSRKPSSLVVHLIRECQLFASWTRPTADFETQIALGDLQRSLAILQSEYAATELQEEWRSAINQICAQWSQRLLELSGLLNVKPETLPR